MLPVLTPSQMAAVDAAAPEPIDELIDRAGRAVARVALDMLGGSYGRVVVVIAGKGNNGADGRVAAAVLRRRGVQVKIFDAAALPATLPTERAFAASGWRLMSERHRYSPSTCRAVSTPSRAWLRAMCFALIAPSRSRQ